MELCVQLQMRSINQLSGCFHTSCFCSKLLKHSNSKHAVLTEGSHQQINMNNVLCVNLQHNVKVRVVFLYELSYALSFSEN